MIEELPKMPDFPKNDFDLAEALKYKPLDVSKSLHFKKSYGTDRFFTTEESEVEIDPIEDFNKRMNKLCLSQRDE